MNDFFVRLKQRKLVQWTIAYVAFAFALIQVLDVVAGSYDWPRTAMHIVFGLLALGFVVTVILAWYHGERGAQRVSGVELLLIALALAIGGGLLWHFARAPAKPATNAVASTRASPASPSASGATAHATSTVAAPASSAAMLAASPIAAHAIPAKSVAVLPFENLSTDKGNAYFADGIQDLILTKLADIGDLKVISRTSTISYGSHPENLTKVGEQLGVATILEGSVQKAGNQVLINVQLIDAKTDSHIWAQDYTRTLDNIFGVEGEVAEKVAKALNAKLTESENAAIAKLPTHNKQALDDYLRGTYYINRNVSTEDPEELKHGIALLQQATRADPEFTEAFGSLSLAYQHLGGHAQQAQAAAQRALALNPGSPNAHRMVAYTLMEEGKFKEALREARKAVELAPKSALMNNGLGNVYFSAGQLDAAASSYRRALKLDPTANFIRTNLGNLLASQRRYVEARDILEAATMRDPSNIRSAVHLAAVQELGWGDLAAARTALQGVSAPVASSGVLSDAWYWLDLYARDYRAALAVIGHAPAAWFEQQAYPLALYQAQVYRAQGNTAQASRKFAQARDDAKAAIKKQPNNPVWHAALALALAGLDDAKGAVAEAQSAVRLDNEPKDNPFLPNLAVVEAWTGNTTAALKHLEELLAPSTGNICSTNLLKIDPTWDSIRHDPAFQVLLKKYSKPQTTATASTGATATQ